MSPVVCKENKAWNFVHGDFTGWDRSQILKLSSPNLMPSPLDHNGGG